MTTLKIVEARLKDIAVVAAGKMSATQSRDAFLNWLKSKGMLNGYSAAQWQNKTTLNGESLKLTRFEGSYSLTGGDELKKAASAYLKTVGFKPVKRLQKFTIYADDSGNEIWLDKKPVVMTFRK